VRILVTNDDGIDSVGLHVLARAMRPFGEVTIVAPDREYSGAGAALGALHLMQPDVQRRAVDGIGEAWAVDGPPALCVMFARLGAFGRRFDLVVSGINPGANVGRSVYHSGTVGACLAARTGGISGVAVSQAVTGFGVEGQGWDEMLIGQKWESAAEVAAAYVGALIASMPAEPVVVNLNVPNLPVEQIKGWRTVRLGIEPPRRLSSATLEPKEGHEGSYHVRMTWGESVTLPEDTDGGTVERDVVSVSYLSRIVAEPRDDLAGPEAALTGIVGRA